jgi:hypothetical protein
MEKVLLTIDALANLVLGVILLLFPVGAGQALGAPAFTDLFYPTLLGGVLVGISLALFIQRFRGSLPVSGLGVEGAIVAIVVFLIAAFEVLWRLRGSTVDDRGA